MAFRFSRGVYTYYVIMFALVYYSLDRKTLKIPASFIKKFNPKNIYDFDCDETYRAYWSQKVSKNQAEKHSYLLKSLKVPAKNERNTKKGETYYQIKILRLEESLEKLNMSLEKYPVTIPDIEPITTTDFITSEDSSNDEHEHNEEEELFTGCVENQRLEDILDKTIDERNSLFLDTSDVNPNVDMIPNTVPNLPLDVSEVISSPVDSLSASDTMDLKKENETLRKLNQALQEQILKLLEKENPAPDVAEKESVAEDVDLGNGVFIKKKVLEALFTENTVSKFVKGLAVAIWGEDVLCERSVTGTACRNLRGCKRKLEGQQKLVAEARQKLTPEKMNVVTVWMEEYMSRRKFPINERTQSLKKRNKYVMEKITDLRAKRKFLELLQSKETVSVKD